MRPGGNMNMTGKASKPVHASAIPTRYLKHASAAGLGLAFEADRQNMEVGFGYQYHGAGYHLSVRLSLRYGPARGPVERRMDLRYVFDKRKVLWIWHV
jgi:hypothetical protein